MTISLDNGAVVVQTQDQILAELNATFTATFGADFTLTDDAFTYRQNAIFANREADLQSLIASAVSAADIEHATGRQLDYIGALLGAPRKAATRSTIPATLYGTPGQAVGDRRVKYTLTADQWRTPVGATIGPSGSVDVTLASEATGAIFATAQSSNAWVIVDVTTGFARLESTADAQRGRARELDPAYRARLESTRSATGGTEPAARAAIANINGVTVFSYDPNRSPVVNGNGVPAWHAEAVISGGTDADIATTIYNVYGGTTGFFGNTEYLVTDPTDGTTTTVRWSRITEYQITADLSLQLAGDTPLPVNAVAVVIEAVANRINTNGPGIDVDPGDLLAAAALALPPGTVEPDDSVCLVAFKGGTAVAVPLIITLRENAFAVTLDQPAEVQGTTAAPFNLTAGWNLDVTTGDGPLVPFVIDVADYVTISAATITELVAAFSRDAPANLLVGSSNGALVLTSVDTGAAATIAINVTSDAGLLATLGLSVGVSSGTGTDITVTFTGP